jgi:hypothetical protein
MKISAASVMRQRATAAIARLVREGVISTVATSLASGLRRDTSAPPGSQGRLSPHGLGRSGSILSRAADHQRITGYPGSWPAH